MNKKAVIFVITFLVLLCLALLGLTLYFALKKQDLEKHKDICTTKECALTAANIIKYMKPELDPCEDFDEFACGDFRRRHPVADDEEYTSMWTVFGNYFELQLQDAIETLNPDKEPYIVRQFQEGYHVCINNSFQPDVEFAALKKLMKDVYEWPIATGQNWKPKHVNFFKFIESIERVGMPNPLFTIAHGLMTNDTKKLGAQVATKSLISFSESPTDADKKIEEAGYELLRTLAREFGNDDSATVDLDLRQMKEASEWMQKRLDTELANVEEETALIWLRDFNSRSRNKIDWPNMLNVKMPKEAYIYKVNDGVAVYQKKFLLLILDALEKYDLRVIYNLFGWKALIEHSLVSTSGAKGEKMLAKYNSANPNHEAEARDTRPVECINHYKDEFPMVATRIFVNKYVDKKDKELAEELIKNILTSYRKIIEDSAWVDEATKKKALLKADNIVRHVAYPDFIFDDQKIDEYHKDAPKVESTEFLNNLKRLAYKERRKFMAFGYNRKEDLWAENPLVKNAFYIAMSNSIWFPTAILQMPFFDGTRLAAINYGGIGTSIGHEVGHGYDVMGSQYNEFGLYENWWTKKTGDIYKEKTKCFIKQFDNYCPEALQGDPNQKICVDGTRTLGENMADFSGIKAAFQAYKLWVKKHGEEPRLPGLTQYSPEQLFFIAFGFIWCDNTPPDKWVERFASDEHAHARYRILGTLSNSEDFRKVFNCPPGKMNRDKDSCSLW